LPIDPIKVRSIAVIGANANRNNALGGGSSQVRALYEITPLAGLKNIASNIQYHFAQGYTIERNAKANVGLIAEAVQAAKNPIMPLWLADGPMAMIIIIGETMPMMQKV